jgi:hypothetical protein
MPAIHTRITSLRIPRREEHVAGAELADRAHLLQHLHQVLILLAFVTQMSAPRPARDLKLRGSLFVQVRVCSLVVFASAGLARAAPLCAAQEVEVDLAARPDAPAL